MVVILGAAGDTWGVSGPDFLRVYLLSLAAFVVVAILFRLSSRLGRSAAQVAGRTRVLRLR